MSRARVMAAPAQAAKTAMPVSARTSARASVRGRTNTDALTNENKRGEQIAEASQWQWSIGQMALDAPPKSPGGPGRRGLPAEMRRALDSSRGEKLPVALAREFGRKFKRDLGGVRIHRDGVASEAVQSIGANAFARGNDLYFRAGAYQLDSLFGQALLAHELTHTVQQTQDANGSGLHSERSEEHAQRAARHHAAGHPFLSAGPPTPVEIAADNGVSFEDEEGQVSRLGTDQEAAEKVADLQQDADRARAAADVTDAATQRTGPDSGLAVDLPAGPDKAVSTPDDGRTATDSSAAATDALSVESPENVSHLDPALDETSAAHTTGNDTGEENSTRVEDAIATEGTPAGEKTSEAPVPDDPEGADKLTADEATGDEIWSQINDEMGLEPPLDRPAPANPAKNEPARVHKNRNKSKGVGGEVAVPFDRYPGLDWNHIGGGSETASSRANLARRSSYDIRRGQEGTAGHDYLVKYRDRETKLLVIGEQKATQGNSFTDATAITSSLEPNVTRNIEVLEEKLQSGEVQDPAEVADLKETIGMLKETREALQKGARGEPARLPEGVVFELTNVGGEGKQVGNGHIELLEKKYGKNPEFLEHLLDRTSVRDPDLAKARGRDPNGKRGTASDPDIVPAKDILTPQAQDTLARLRAGKTKKQWQQQKKREEDQQSKAENAAKAARKKRRADAESAARKQARKAGEKARLKRLKQLQDDETRKNEPEARTKGERDKVRSDLERKAEHAGTEVENAEIKKFLEARKQQERDARTAREAEVQAQREADRQEREAKVKEEQEKTAQREQKDRETRARHKALVDEVMRRHEARKAQEAARVTSHISTDKPGAQADKAAQSERQSANLLPSPDAQQKATQAAGQQKLEAARKSQEAMIANSRAAASAAAAGTTDAKGTEANRTGGISRESAKTAASPSDAHVRAAAQHQANEPAPHEWKRSTTKNPPEKAPIEHKNTAQPHEGAGGLAMHAANQGAAGIRAYDAFQGALKRNESVARASIDAGQAYLAATNPVAGAVSTAAQRMQKDEKGEQYYGNDALDAWLGTLGETTAGYIEPGEKWDQAVNAAGNLFDAVDDHMEKNADPKAPRNNGVTARMGVDLATELTPSREFSTVVGAGARGYYDVGRAFGGDASGVDKFGEDAMRGKLGSIIQPWAMTADFAGNLGSSTPSQALDKTIKKTEGTTLKKTGDALGDAAFKLGQNKEAKAGKYGAAVQGIAGALSMSNDMIAGKTFEQALDNAAGQSKDNTVAQVGEALGDAAFTTVQKGKDLINEDLPAAKKKVAAVIDESKEKLANWWKKL